MLSWAHPKEDPYASAIAPADYKPRDYVIGGRKYTANTPAEAIRLEQLRTKEASAGAGRPDAPIWASLLGKDGMMDAKYQLSGSVADSLADDAGYNKFEQEALRDGPSTMAEMMLQRQDLDRKDQIGDISSQYQMGVQNAMDSLASQGGSYSGAGERIGASSIRDMLSARQGARNESNKNRLGILAQDEQNRIGQLQNLSGMEMDRNRLTLQGKEFDINNSLKENDAKRTNAYNMWEKETETWASNKQADAQARAAGGGCFPAGTLIMMEDDTEKKIEDIELGDSTMGGKVTKLMKGSAKDVLWYDYKGVIVTGGHAVFEDHEWKRIYESKKGQLIDLDVDLLFNFSTDDHEIWIQGIVFSDFDDVDNSTLSYEEALVEKNRGVNV